MTHIDTIIAEIEAELPQYKTAGLIDKASMYRWAKRALKKFGQSICTPQEKVIQVKNGVAHLPEHYHSLIFAVKCSPLGYNCSTEDIPVLQNSLIWKERIENTTTWDSCEPCCTTESEKIITENTYINDKLISFYYDSSIPLKLGKRMKRSACASSCRNLAVYDCPYEIVIDETTLHANFTDGTIYLQFYGIEVDEKGLFWIPETPRGYLEEYIEQYLTMKLYKQLITNGDDVNIGAIYGMQVQEVNDLFRKASSDARFLTLTPESYNKVAMQNSLDMLRIKYLLPNF